MKWYPNLYFARRIAVDIGCDNPLEVHGAIKRRAPGLLFINARRDELSSDQYADLCYAIESEVERTRRSAMSANGYSLGFRQKRPAPSAG